MPEPHTSLVAAVYAFFGSIVTGLIVVFRSGRAYEKLTGNIGAINLMLENHIKSEDQSLDRIDKRFSRMETRIDDLFDQKK